MGSQRLFLQMSIVLVIGCTFFGSSEGYKFVVGGKDGWDLHPSENYNHWAERNRFQVNDTLYFKYNKSSDSVLVVNKDEYNSCNNKNPIVSLADGNSTFEFDRSGPFFFITGNSSHCKNGQKMIIVVLAVRHTASPPSTTPQSPPPMAPTSNFSQVQPPSPSSTTNHAHVPAPVPSKSGTQEGLTGLVFGLVLGACVGVSLTLLGSFDGMV